MTSAPHPDARAARGRNAVEAMAGLLSAAAVTLAIVGIAYRPARLTPVALVIALVAVVMGGRSAALARWAVFIVGICWFVGMIVAVVTKNPVY